MKILFLDVETSDVSPLMGQVIEVGGVVADLDPVHLAVTVLDQFESLIRNRKTFDEKITRITGITLAELSSAPVLPEVQEAWASWLESYAPELVAICGHSIEFDLNFLRSESWFLPTGIKIIDTLHLAKILWTNWSAVNLEFLMAKLKLPDFLAAANRFATTAPQQAHRALFDTWCSVGLFQAILEHLEKTHFAPEFYNFLNSELLPLGLHFYSSGQNWQAPNNQPPPLSVTYVDLAGKILEPTSSEKFNSVCAWANQQTIDQLLELLSTSLPLDLKSIVAACYVSIIHKKQHPQQRLKLHIHGDIEKVFAELLVEFLAQDLPLTRTDQNTRYVLTAFENLLWQIKHLSQEVLDLGKLITYLEIYQKMAPQNQSKIAAALAAYDFFLLTMEPYWATNYYQYDYQPANLLGPESLIQDKFAALLQHLQDLPRHYPVTHSLDRLLQNKIVTFMDQLDQLHLSPKNNYHFQLLRQKLVISWPKPNFELNSSLNSLFTKFPNLEVATYLPPDQFATLLDCTQSSAIFDTHQIQVIYLNDQQTTYQQRTVASLLEVLQQQLTVALAKQAPVLILTGNNSALKKVQKLLTDHFAPTDYLSLGESGSLTKVYSKLIRGFVGLVNVRVGDFGFIHSQSPKPKFASIWLIGQPWMFIQDHWQDLAKQQPDPQAYVLTLQDLNLHAQTGWIFHETGLVVNYWPLT